MILSDGDILEGCKRGAIAISPFDSTNIQPASYDVALSAEIRRFTVLDDDVYPIIDPRRERELTRLERVDKWGYFLEPGDFILGCTVERISLSNGIVARLEGKSSLGRLGLLVHATAGFIDPGFDGQITLELSNLTRYPIKLYPNMKIAQVSFMQMTRPSDNPYGTAEVRSKYQGQSGPTPSLYYMNDKEIYD